MAENEPVPPTTADDKKPPEPTWLERLRRPETRRRAALEVVGFFLWITFVMYCFAVLVAVAQMFALGFHGALAAYGRRWGVVPIKLSSIFFGGMVALIAIIGAFATLGRAVVRAIGASDAQLGRMKTVVGKVWTVLWGTAVVGGSLLGLMHHSYSEALSDHKPVHDPAATISDGKTAIANQRDVIAKLSGSAAELLAGLDKTAGEFQHAKDEVTATLARLSAQQDAVESANKELEDLVKQEADLKLQQAEVNRFLHDLYVPTRAEIDRGVWIERLFGFASGIVASIVAAWVWQRVQQRRRPSATT